MKQLVNLGAALALTCAPTFLNAAESLEIGIDELSREIMERTVAAGQFSVAVGTFTHRDGACSDLTNLIYDELVYGLFANGGNDLRVIERAELEQIISEQELSLSGAIDVETAKELGRISGVETIALGSISEFGDKVRINSRLVDAGTGQVFSVAKTDFPLTDTTRDLMSNRSRSFCGFGSPAQAASQTSAVQTGSTEVINSVTSGGIVVSLASITADDKGAIERIVFELENTSDEITHFTLFDPRREWVNISDRSGNFVSVRWIQSRTEVFSLMGADICRADRSDRCETNDWTAVNPGSISRMTLAPNHPDTRFTAPLLIRLNLMFSKDGETVSAPIDFRNIYF